MPRHIEKASLIQFMKSARCGADPSAPRSPKPRRHAVTLIRRQFLQLAAAVLALPAARQIEAGAALSLSPHRPAFHVSRTFASERIDAWAMVDEELSSWNVGLEFIVTGFARIDDLTVCLDECG